MENMRFYESFTESNHKIDFGWKGKWFNRRSAFLSTKPFQKTECTVGVPFTGTLHTVSLKINQRQSKAKAGAHVGLTNWIVRRAAEVGTAMCRRKKKLPECQVRAATTPWDQEHQRAAAEGWKRTGIWKLRWHFLVIRGKLPVQQKSLREQWAKTQDKMQQKRFVRKGAAIYDG